MKRILVTGNIGSGKTTLCKKLSSMLGIPAYHFDQVAWQASWKRPTPEERETKTRQLLEKTEWVIDGVSKELMECADTIVFLDFPRVVCAWRTLKRNIQCRFQTRPEMPANCPDYKHLPFITRIIWCFPRKQNPWILEAMDRMRYQKRVVHIQNNAERQVFIESVI